MVTCGLPSPPPQTTLSRRKCFLWTSIMATEVRGLPSPGVAQTHCSALFFPNSAVLCMYALWGGAQQLYQFRGVLYYLLSLVLTDQRLSMYVCRLSPMSH